MPSLAPEQAAFEELAVRLRKLGAVRVREGVREVAFGPLAPEPPAERADLLAPSERQELDRLRSLAEELP